jgi:hypothetical protein
MQGIIATPNDDVWALGLSNERRGFLERGNAGAALGADAQVDWSEIRNTE